MLLGQVIGSVWTTQKESGMDSLKLLVIQPINPNHEAYNNPIIAVDRIGAGVGEIVIVTRGTPAQKALGDKNIPVDAVVVGIVDALEVSREKGG